MKKRRVALAVGVLGAAVWAIAPAQGQPGGVLCEGVLTGVINANVTVPPGGDCRIRDAIVNGNVEVKSTGGLIVEGSTINGNVRGSGPEYWGFTDDQANDTDPQPEFTVIRGNVELVETISNPAAGMSGSMSRYNFACEGTDFRSNVSIRGSRHTADFLFGSPDGGANMMRAPDLNSQVRECSEMPMQEDEREGNHVFGNYEALGNTSEVRQRDNLVDGHFSLFGNVAATPGDDIDVIRNTVRRHLTCQGNVPVPHQEGNQETGPGSDGDQCPP